MADFWMERMKWSIAYTVLYAVPIFGLLPLFIASIINISQRKDQARRGFIWHKVALGQTVLGNLMVTVSNILIILFNMRFSSSFAYSQRYADAINQLSVLGSFILTLSYMFTFLMILDVAQGILYCWEIGHARRRLVQWVVYALMLVLAALAIAKLGLQEAWLAAISAYYKSSGGRANFPNERISRANQIVVAVFYILLWIASTGLLGLLASVMIRARKRAEHRQAAILVFVTGILFWIESLWSLVSVAVWTLPMRSSPGTWDVIIDPILGTWLQFIIFVLVFVIGRKKAGGLWSIPQNSVAKQQDQDYIDQPVGH